MEENRQISIEVIRLVSAFFIIWFHSEIPYLNEISYSGLIYFVFMSAYYSGFRRNNSLNILHKLRKLFYPWIFWSFIYGIGYAVKGDAWLKYADNLVTQILVGNAMHLWYLPFIFIAITILDIIRTRFNQSSYLVVCYILTLLYFLLAIIWRPASLNLLTPLPQYCHAIGGILVGFLLGSLHRVAVNPSKIIIIIGTILISVVMAYDAKGVGIPYICGITMAIIGLQTGNLFKFNKNIQRLASCSYGIYLIHPILFYFFSPQDLGFLSPVLVFIVSLAVILLLRSMFPRLSYYVT